MGDVCRTMSLTSSASCLEPKLTIGKDSDYVSMYTLLSMIPWLHLVLLSAQSLDPMTSRDSPPRPSAMLKRAFSLPISQMAWREVRRGPPAQALEQLKVPVMHDLAPGELLVRVEAAALNPMYAYSHYVHLVSNMCRSGYKLMQMLPNVMAKRPHTAESDFTGVVVATQGVTGFEDGEPVCGWISQREWNICEWREV